MESDYDKAFKILVDLSPIDWALLTGLRTVSSAVGMETDLPERTDISIDLSVSPIIMVS